MFGACAAQAPGLDSLDRRSVAGHRATEQSTDATVPCVRWLLAFVLVMLPTASRAKCAPVNRCGCDQQPDWAAIVRWDAEADGGTSAVLETISTSSGHDAGPDVTRWNSYGPAGSRMVFTDQEESVPITADGGIRCGNVGLAASTWPAALTDRSCARLLDEAGVVQPPCRDSGSALNFIGCGCSASSAPLLMTTLGLLMLWRRRRQ